MDASHPAPAVSALIPVAPAGLFVAVEGIDHSGKTTLTGSLADHLRANGYRVAVIKEPSAEPLGALMRQLSATALAPPTALALLSAADRHHRQPALLSDLATAAVVVADRYYLSGLAYHCADGVDPDLYRRCAHGIRLPDLYLYLDVPVSVAAARVTRPPDGRWEQPAFAARLPAAYRRCLDELIRAENGPAVVRLDASQPALAVLDAALAVVLERLTSTRTRTPV